MRLTICKHSLLYQYVKEFISLDELLAEVNARAAKRLSLTYGKMGHRDSESARAAGARGGRAYKPATLRVMREERVPA